MKHLVALVSGFGWHVRDLARASKVVGVKFDPVAFPKVVGRVGARIGRVEAEGIDLGSVDGVLVRMMPPGSLERVVFRMDALHVLEAKGVPVLNPPRAVEAAVDKYLALARLQAAGLPVPETWVGESSTEALAAFESLGGDVVVKPLFGSEGRGLVRVSHPEMARRTFHALERLGSVLYVQRYVRNPGYDIRVFILDSRVVGAIRRFAPDGEWRTNVSVGGRPEACDPDDEVCRLAILAARSLHAGMAGVDLMPDLEGGGWTVLEVNAVPGWRALAGETSIDVASLIFAHLRDLAR